MPFCSCEVSSIGLNLCAACLPKVWPGAGYVQHHVQHPQGPAHPGPVVRKLLQHQPLVGLHKSHLQSLLVHLWRQRNQVQDYSQGEEQLNSWNDSEGADNEGIRS